MYNTFFIILSLVLLFSVIYLMVYPYLSNKKNSISIPFKVNNILAFIMCVCSISVHIFPNNNIFNCFIITKAIFGALISVFMYIYIYNKIKIKPLNINKKILLFIIPVLTTLLLSISTIILLSLDVLSPFEKKYSVFSSNIFDVVFYINSIYSYIIGLSILILLLQVFFTTPKIPKKNFYFLFISLLLHLIISIEISLGIIDYSFDLSLISTVVTLYACYFSLNNNYTNTVKIVSRNYIYNNLDNMIFILSNDRLILDCNNYAKKLLDLIGFNKKQVLFDEFFNCWLKNFNGRISPYDNSIITITEGFKEYHTKIEEKALIADDNNLGYLVIFQDITEVYFILRSLEESAFYDSLTGLYNRNMYIQRIKEFMNKKYMPLGIILGDVNNLKTINDTLGHLVGDELLKDVAKIISSNSPLNSFVTRIGGDEFIIVITNSNEEQCNKILRKIQNACSIFFNKLYGFPSIALGTAIVLHENQDIATVIEQADKLMYKDKNDRRKKNSTYL